MTNSGPAERTNPSHRTSQRQHALALVQGPVGSTLGKYAGYDQIAQALSTRFDVETIRPPGYRTRIIPGRIWKRLALHSGVEWYQRPSLDLETAAARHLLRSRNTIYHVLHGEDYYRYLGLIARAARRRGCSVVCTFHQPPAILEKIVRAKGALRHLDGLFVLGTNQAVYFSEIVGAEKVFVVSHGVDVDFFTPGHAEAPVPTCLFVGSWLRDFEMVRAVSRRLRDIAPEVAVKVVTSDANAEPLRDLRNVVTASGLSDEQLRDTYRSASVLLLPLTDCVANNALLEAMSCGTPVVATDVGAIRDYLDEDCGVFVGRGESHQMADAAADIATSRTKQERMGKAARRRALDFSWERVGAQHVELYSRIATARSRT